MAETNRNSYGSILKATGLFGGVKVFEILISVIRSKFVAVLLGPSGMGIYGLITSATGLVKQITGFGLGTSGVREVSKAYGEGDEYKKNYIVTILRKLVWMTGMLGLVFTFFMAKWLSLWSFGNTDYTIWFRIVSVTLLIDQIIIGQRVLMQGTFHYSFLAKATLIGDIVGLIVTIPLYYFFGVKGIVPVIILHSLTRLILSWCYARKINFIHLKLTLREVLRGGGTTLKLGFAIAMTGAVTLGAEYLLRIFISHAGDVADVGLFNAGIAMATQYIAVILTAMSSDYIPRLSASSSNNRQYNEIINRQMQLLIVIIGPVVGLFLVYIREVVLLLYSSKFIPITGMIEWIMFGMFFRSISFCLSYAVVAKADSNRFFWNELVAALYRILLYVVGYKLYGFDGMGIAYALGYVLYSLQMYLFCKIRYGFHFEGRTIRIVACQMLVVILLLSLTKLLHYTVNRYVFGTIWLIVIAYISYLQLNKMIDVKQSVIVLREKIFKRHDK